MWWGVKGGGDAERMSFKGGAPGESSKQESRQQSDVMSMRSQAMLVSMPCSSVSISEPTACQLH